MSDERGPLESAVMAAVEADGIDPKGPYGALIALCCTYAKQIDRVPVDAGQERTKTLYLGPHLSSGLKELGLTPKGKAELEKEYAQRRAAEAQTAGDMPTSGTPGAKGDELARIRHRRGGVA